MCEYGSATVLKLWQPRGNASLKCSQDLSSGVAQFGELTSTVLYYCAFALVLVACSAICSKIDTVDLADMRPLALWDDLLIM
jgi:hypothetical protein